MTMELSEEKMSQLAKLISDMTAENVAKQGIGRNLVHLHAEIRVANVFLSILCKKQIGFSHHAMGLFRNLLFQKYVAEFSSLSLPETHKAASERYLRAHEALRALPADQQELLKDLLHGLQVENDEKISN